MNLLLTSARRVWTKRPAGPLLIAVGVLIATLLAGGTELALESAEVAQEERDLATLGHVQGRILTPGGYTVDQAAIAELQAEVATARASQAPDRHVPLYLEREALVTAGGSTTSGWTVLGLPLGSLQALDLPVPDPGQALIDPGEREAAPEGGLELRLQQAPQEEVALRASFQGQLARTVQVAGMYIHDDADRYIFQVNVSEGTQRLELFLSTANNDTDFDLEATGPNGTQRLDDAGSPGDPQMPRIVVQEPAPGSWQVQVHAKLANGVAFRLEAESIFDARDAQALGRLLEGQGFRAVGAQLGLTEQAIVPVSAQPTDLSALGPGDQGLIVLPLDELTSALALPGEATGLLLLSTPGQNPLVGLPADELGAIERTVDAARASTENRLDPIQGLVVQHDAGDLRQAREDQLASTEALLLVVLPSGVVAGILLATWAATLHTRRLQGELRVLAGLGQPRSTSATLALLHLGPPFLAGALLALLLAPLVGLALARGIGLQATPTLLPGLMGLVIPLVAAVPVAAVAWATLRAPIQGQDPRTGRTPQGARKRALVAGLWLALAVVLVLGLTLDLAPTDQVLIAALAACAAGLAVLWAPLLEPLLAQARMVTVGALGLLRTRSTHANLGLAAATVTLVLTAMLTGVALSQAATPDAELEAGGYPVIATTPTFVDRLSDRLSEEDPARAQRAGELLGQTLGVETLMRVTGTGIHSAPTQGLQTVYGIDTSFAQRHGHQVQPTGQVDDPVDAVARSDDAAVVSRSVWQALDDDSIFIQGPQGRLSYQVVGVVETRLLEGVYISKEALPTHFTQIAGEQRFLLPDETDPEVYAASLQDSFRHLGMAAASSQSLVDDELDGQQRAGTTLQATAGLGLVTALLLVVLIGLRAKAERRSSDAVLVSLGARERQVALGIATETLLPVVVGTIAAMAVVLPVLGVLDQLEGLAFPLLPIDTGGLLLAAGLTVAGILVLAAVVSVAVGVHAVRGLDQQALRELG